MGVDLRPSNTGERRKVSVTTFKRMKAEGKKIVMVTSYDYPTAAIADEVGVDSILVGDSYGMVVLGYDNTIPVTVDELLPVCRAVRRGATSDYRKSFDTYSWYWVRKILQRPGSRDTRHHRTLLKVHTQVCQTLRGRVRHHQAIA